MICDHNLHASLVEGALRSSARTVWRPHLRGRSPWHRRLGSDRRRRRRADWGNPQVVRLLVEMGNRRCRRIPPSAATTTLASRPRQFAVLAESSWQLTQYC